MLPPVLRLVHRQRRSRQRVAGVEAIVAPEVVKRAAHGVGAALGHDVDVAAERAPELGLRAGGDHLKLVDGVDPVGDAAQRRRVVIRRQAVDNEVVRKIALAADREAHARHGGCFREELRAADVGRRHPRHEQPELDEVAAVERQALHFGFGNGCRDLTAGGFEHRRLAGDGDVGLEPAHRQNDRQLERRTRCQRQRPAHILEARELDRDGVRTDAEVGEPEAALLIGDDTADDVGVRVSGLDERAGDRGAARVGDAAADAGVIHRLLRERLKRDEWHGERHEDQDTYGACAPHDGISEHARLLERDVTVRRVRGRHASNADTTAGDLRRAAGIKESGFGWWSGGGRDPDRRRARGWGREIGRRRR